MQLKVMTQACHVVIPRPIVDNIQPEGQRMRCVCLVVVPSSSVVDNTQPEEGGQRMSVFMLMGLWRLSLWVT